MPVGRELRTFLEDEAGAELVEWAVVTMVLLAATVVALIAIGDELERIFTSMLDQLERFPEG
jgi:Flp pilus assembly pilin Flp